MKITTEKIIIILLSIVIIVLSIKGCNKSSTTNVPVGTTKYLKDSSHYFEQQVAISESQKEIKKLEDSLQRAMSGNSKITPETLIKYKEKLIYAGVDAKYLDSIDNYLITVIAQQKVIDSLNHTTSAIDYSKIISVPRKFTFNKKWISGEGTIYKDKTVIDTIDIVSEPTIVFGEKKGIITALVGNNNPYATQSEVKAYQYKPKKSRFSLVVGPTYTFTGTNLKFGVGITAGFRIF